MGIHALIKSIESLSEKDSHIRKWRCNCVAVDVSSWMFKGAFSCIDEIFHNGPKSTNKYINYVLNKADMFRYFGIEPILVFDGRRTQLKDAESQRRRKNQQHNADKANEFLQLARRCGNHEQKQQYQKIASDYIRKSVHITWEMNERTIDALKKRDFRVVVAPYEADAQVAYLCKMGWAAAAVTEDSDVIVYSACCERPFPVLMKLENSGQCREFVLDPKILLPKIKKVGTGRKGSFLESIQKMLYEKDWRRLFVQTACLSGCDYIDSLPGVGIASAARMVEAMKRVSSKNRFRRVLYHYQHGKGVGGKGEKKIPDGFLKELEAIEFSFHFYRVFDPSKSKCVFFNDPQSLPDFGLVWKEWDISAVLGEDIPQQLATYICNGCLDPKSKSMPGSFLPALPQDFRQKPLVRNQKITDTLATKAPPDSSYAPGFTIGGSKVGIEQASSQSALKDKGCVENFRPFSQKPGLSENLEAESCRDVVDLTFGEKLDDDGNEDSSSIFGGIDSDQDDDDGYEDSPSGVDGIDFELDDAIFSFVMPVKKACETTEHGLVKPEHNKKKETIAECDEKSRPLGDISNILDAINADSSSDLDNPQTSHPLVEPLAPSQNHSSIIATQQKAPNPFGCQSLSQKCNGDAGLKKMENPFACHKSAIGNAMSKEKNIFSPKTALCQNERGPSTENIPVDFREVAAGHTSQPHNVPINPFRIACGAEGKPNTSISKGALNATISSSGTPINLQEKAVSPLKISPETWESRKRKAMASTVGTLSQFGALKKTLTHSDGTLNTKGKSNRKRKTKHNLTGTPTLHHFFKAC